MLISKNKCDTAKMRTHKTQHNIKRAHGYYVAKWWGDCLLNKADESNSLMWRNIFRVISIIWRRDTRRACVQFCI